jgi:hypothetical protein
VTNLDIELLFKDDTFFHIPDDFPTQVHHDDDHEEGEIVAVPVGGKDGELAV